MSIGIGIIGPSQSGKTTIFNALTGNQAATGFHKASSEPEVGIVKVPDPRLLVLAELFKSRKTVPAEIKFTDIGASVKSLAEAKGISGELLNALNQADALMVVIRAFADEAIAHPEGSLDPARDFASMEMELTFSDLVILEKRLERLEASLKGARTTERDRLTKEKELLNRLKASLEEDIPLREITFTPEEAKLISGYQFLTAKPLLVVINIDEDSLAERESVISSISASGKTGFIVTSLAGKLEMEISQLDNDAAEDFRHDFEMGESGADMVIRDAYHLLGLISFLTTGPDESRAWTIPQHTTAVKAASKIHSDIERGFIRAEVISYENLVDCQTLPEAKKRGLLRLEGKDYPVKDGDVINFLFNV